MLFFFCCYGLIFAIWVPARIVLVRSMIFVDRVFVRLPLFRDNCGCFEGGSSPVEGFRPGFLRARFLIRYSGVLRRGGANITIVAFGMSSSDVSSFGLGVMSKDSISSSERRRASASCSASSAMRSATGIW